MNLNERKARFAFSIEDYNAPRRLKNNDTFVKWEIRLFGYKDHEVYERMIPFHRCTDEDYE